MRNEEIIIDYIIIFSAYFLRKIKIEKEIKPVSFCPNICTDVRITWFCKTGLKLQ